MVSPLVIDNWASALFDVIITQTDDVTKVVAEIKSLVTLWKEIPAYKALLAQANFPLVDKLKLLQEAFANELQSDLYHFLCLLVKQNRIVVFENICHVLLTKFASAKHEYFGQVFSVIKLTNDQMTAIQKKLYTKFAVKVQLVNIVDKSLIGGVKVCFQDYVFDNSIKELLANWRQTSLLAAKGEINGT